MAAVIHGWEIVAEASKWLGVKYVFGAEVGMGDDPAKKGWDCSEFVQYVLDKLGFAEVYGHQFPDGAANQYNFCKTKGNVIDIDEARHTPGCLVWMVDSDGKIFHVGISDGGNNTIEARGKDYGTGKWPWRKWHRAALIPNVKYTGGTDNG